MSEKEPTVTRCKASVKVLCDADKPLHEHRITWDVLADGKTRTCTNGRVFCSLKNENVLVDDGRYTISEVRVK